MRHVLIVLAIAGCGGHSRPTDSDAAAPPRPMTRDDIAHACVNAYAALGPPIDGPTVANCLRHLDDIDTLISIYRPAQIRCLVAAGADRAAARACLGYTFGACSPDGQRCDGDRVINCRSGSSITLDCRNGLWFGSDSTCVLGTSVSGTSIDCGVGTCTDGTPAQCDGSRVLKCKNGVQQAFDCAPAGASCSSASGSALCVGAGAACTAARCEGNQLIRCEGGHELRYACDAMFDGGTCLGYGRDGASCGFGPDCGSSAACAGNVTQLCVLGAQVSVDCIAAGFAGCDLGSCIPAKFP